MLNPAKLYELYAKLEKAGVEDVPGHTHMLYLVGQTRDNQDSVLDQTLNWSGLIGFIGYPNTEEVFGYPGSDVWTEALIERDRDPRNFRYIYDSFITVGGKRIVHTLSEMQAMVRFAKEKDMRSVAIVAPPFHLMRAFMSAVLAAQIYYPTLRIHPRLGELDWNASVRHSQGKVVGTPASLLVSEITRIFTYQAQGLLPTPEEALAHLDRL